MSHQADFNLYTTLRYDERLLRLEANTNISGAPFDYFFLPLHRDRLATAAEAFGWTDALEASKGEAGLKRLTELCKDAVKTYFAEHQGDRNAALKIRVLLSKEGKFTAETGPTPARNYDLLSGSIFHPTLTLPTSHPSPLIKIYIDSQPTPKSLYTSYKTTRRPHYTAARERANIPAFETPMETLLWNEDEEVTECTIRNVAFWRDGGWVTPPLPTGCLTGVMRRWLLEQGHTKEAIIKRDDVHVGDWVLTSNGLEGCSIGQVVGKL